jgi:hypothetical protein
MSTSTARLWLLGLFLLHAFFHQTSFQAVYLDSDQLVIADQATWMARLEFHEPFFFGQAYLLPFESYVAVPLIWLGIWPIAAVKAVAALSLYLPFVWAAWVLCRERPLAGFAVAALFFGLHPEYMLAASMPRGFITGIALAWVALWVLLRRDELSLPMTLGLAALAGFCTGSNMSIALMLPALAWLPQRRQFVLVGVGLLTGFLVFKAVGLFYKFHPDHIVHLFPKIHFRLGYLVHNSGVPEVAAAVTYLVAVTAVALVIGRWPHGGRVSGQEALRWIACIGAVCLAVALMVANNKIVEFNHKSPFFSVYRMMLPLPFLGLLLLSLPRSEGSAAPAAADHAFSRSVLHGGVWVVALSLLLVLQLYRGWRDGPHLAELPSTVPPITFEWLQANCEEIGGWWRASGAPYFVLEGRNDALAYGCHANYGVPVRQTDHERRTWLKERFAQGVPR